MSRRNTVDADDDSEEDGQWQLSEYELNRPPVVPQDNDTLIRIQWSDLANEMKCPVCLNLITKTMITECMHRFCAECIGKALRLSNKECPTCRTYCATRRALRADKLFDSLIGVVCPDRPAFEAREEKLIQAIIKSACYQDSDPTADAQKPKRKRKARTDDDDYEEDEADAEDLYTRHSRSPSPVPARKPVQPKPKQTKEDEDVVTEPVDALVEFICLPHPDEDREFALERKYLTTSGHCKVSHISKYLWCFLTSDSDVTVRSSKQDAFDLFLQTPDGTFRHLDRMLELREVCRISELVGYHSSLPVLYFAHHQA